MRFFSKYQFWVAVLFLFLQVLIFSHFLEKKRINDQELTHISFLVKQKIEADALEVLKKAPQAPQAPQGQAPRGQISATKPQQATGKRKIDIVTSRPAFTSNPQIEKEKQQMMRFWRRSVPDSRPKACRAKDYEKKEDHNMVRDLALNDVNNHPTRDPRTQPYPQASVIMCFRNETDLILGRSIVSILDRTEKELLKEIILVDDANPIKPSRAVLTLDPKIQMLSNQKVEGLVRSRLRGAAAAKPPFWYFWTVTSRSTTTG